MAVTIKTPHARALAFLQTWTVNETPNADAVRALAAEFVEYAHEDRVQVNALDREQAGLFVAKEFNAHRRG